MLTDVDEEAITSCDVSWPIISCVSIREIVYAWGMSTKKSNSPDFDLDYESETEEPKLYRVLLLNDDYTPMDFVTFVLKKFFSKNETEAHQIMLDVHNKGAGVAGVYSFEVAETKVAQVNQFSKSSEYPLKTTLEEIS